MLQVSLPGVQRQPGESMEAFKTRWFKNRSEWMNESSIVMAYLRGPDGADPPQNLKFFSMR